MKLFLRQWTVRLEYRLGQNSSLSNNRIKSLDEIDYEVLASKIHASNDQSSSYYHHNESETQLYVRENKTVIDDADYFLMIFSIIPFDIHPKSDKKSNDIEHLAFKNTRFFLHYVKALSWKIQKQGHQQPAKVNALDDMLTDEQSDHYITESSPITVNLWMYLRDYHIAESMTVDGMTVLGTVVTLNDLNALKLMSKRIDILHDDCISAGMCSIKVSNYDIDRYFCIDMLQRSVNRQLEWRLNDVERLRIHSPSRINLIDVSEQKLRVIMVDQPMLRTLVARSDRSLSCP